MPQILTQEACVLLRGLLVENHCFASLLAPLSVAISKVSCNQFNKPN